MDHPDIQESEFRALLEDRVSQDQTVPLVQLATLARREFPAHVEFLDNLDRKSQDLGVLMARRALRDQSGLLETPDVTVMLDAQDEGAHPVKMV